MINQKIVYNERGEEIKIELLFSFQVEEFSKNYIVYTINDSDELESAFVFISEIDNNQNIISIPEEEKDLVSEAYEKVKETIMNEI